MRVQYVIILFFTLLGFICAIAFKDHLRKKDDKPKTCTAHVVSFYQNTKLDLFMDFIGTRSARKGSVFLYGTYSAGDEIKGYVRREVKYEWKEDTDNFYFTGVNINKDSERPSLSDDILKNLIPEFYIRPNTQIYFKLKKINNDGWFFYVGKRPILFCALN